MPNTNANEENVEISIEISGCSQGELEKIQEGLNAFLESQGEESPVTLEVIPPENNSSSTEEE